MTTRSKKQGTDDKYIADLSISEVQQDNLSPLNRVNTHEIL